MNEALLDQALRLLSARLGPIARVVVQRSAERTRQREAFFTPLVETAPQPARAKLRLTCTSCRSRFVRHGTAAATMRAFQHCPARP